MFIFCGAEVFFLLDTIDLSALFPISSTCAADERDTNRTSDPCLVGEAFEEGDSYSNGGEGTSRRVRENPSRLSLQRHCDGRNLMHQCSKKD